MNTKNLSIPKMGILGLQHMFAMFGATILVPLLSGLSVQVTLIGVGVGTLIFHLCAKGRVPAFLGSSFAFLVGIRLITDAETGIFAGQVMSQTEKLAYATGGILVSGLVYLLFAGLIKLVGVKTFMKYMPPIVTAPTVVLIGIMLAPFAISQSSENMLLAVITLLIVIVASSWGKGMIKIIPILLGIGGAYIIALIFNAFGMTNADGSAIMDFTAAAEASIVGLPPFMAPRFNIIAILVMVPFALATIAEHVGDMVALSSITGEDFIEDPGLTRTLIGDGVASCFSGLIGGPASTTYGENVGVIALTKVFNPRVVQIAAIYAAVLGFSPMFAQIIYSVPNAIIGGASFMLYGMIAAVGIRNLVESKVDMSKTKNLTVVAVMLVTGLGLRFGPAITFSIGNTNVPVDRLGIAIAVVLGVILNAFLPEGDK
ncbi:MAG: uracil-xanthine permease [Defluviitaleaceae bacterium]|nr:uracil-xanthine permease [Defluviitaleaceae bacterium]